MPHVGPFAQLIEAREASERPLKVKHGGMGLGGGRPFPETCLDQNPVIRELPHIQVLQERESSFKSTVSSFPMSLHYQKA